MKVCFVHAQPAPEGAWGPDSWLALPGPGAAAAPPWSAGRAVQTAPHAADPVIPSPNIWEHPDVYEIENRAVDPDGLLLRAMTELTRFDGARVLDLGCGAGFHLPLFAGLVGAGGSVVGVEPHPPLLAAARERVAAEPHVQVLPGQAQAIPLPAASVDIVHARWAYFFGPGCEPGLAEVERVLRPGGVALIIDNDASRSTFGGWFRRQYPQHDPAAHARFWRRQGYERRRLMLRWCMDTRADFEAVVRIEFEGRLAEAILTEHPGREVDYAVDLWWRRTT